MAQCDDFRCPNCGVRLVKLLQKLRKIEGTNESLRNYLRETEQELEHLGYTSYVASSNKKTFHKPNCHWAGYIKDSVNYIEFSSHREAEDAGYRPCKTCCA